MGLSHSITDYLKTAFGATSVAPAAAPVTITDAVGGVVIAAANAKRKYIIIQNCGTEPCIVRLGGNPTTAAYNFVLEDCTANRDGKGAAIRIDGYQGAIKGIVEANTTVIAVTEIVDL